MIKDFQLGLACSNPRVVTEKVELFNNNDDEDNEGDEGREIEVASFDLKDFFTRISRARFRKDIAKVRKMILEKYPKARFF